MNVCSTSAPDAPPMHPQALACRSVATASWLPVDRVEEHLLEAGPATHPASNRTRACARPHCAAALLPPRMCNRLLCATVTAPPPAEVTTLAANNGAAHTRPCGDPLCQDHRRPGEADRSLPPCCFGPTTALWHAWAHPADAAGAIPACPAARDTTGRCHRPSHCPCPTRRGPLSLRLRLRPRKALSPRLMPAASVPLLPAHLLPLWPPIFSFANGNLSPKARPHRHRNHRRRPAPAPTLAEPASHGRTAGGGLLPRRQMSGLCAAGEHRVDLAPLAWAEGPAHAQVLLAPPYDGPDAGPLGASDPGPRRRP